MRTNIKIKMTVAAAATLLFLYGCGENKNAAQQNEAALILSLTGNANAVETDKIERTQKLFIQVSDNLHKNKARNLSSEKQGNEILNIIADNTTGDERKLTSSGLAVTLGLSDSVKENLISISEDKNAFVSSFSEIMQNVEQPQIPTSANSKNSRSIFSAPTDWGCRWYYNPSREGQEVGPDFWVAAYLCAYARYATNNVSFLVFHQHDWTSPTISWTVWTFE